MSAVYFFFARRQEEKSLSYHVLADSLEKLGLQTEDAAVSTYR